MSLQRRDARIVSRRPLSAGSRGPSYAVVDHRGDHWEVWFEAAGIWSHYRRESPYMTATSGLGGEPRPIGADILLLRLDDRALVLEVKYPYGPHTAGGRARDGVAQAMAYAVEVRSRLAPTVLTSVVVPEGVVSQPSSANTAVGTIGIIHPARLGDLLDQLGTG